MGEKKPQIRKESRDEKALRKLREKKEVDYGKTLARINKQKDYLKNLVNGKYYLARANMIADQIKSKKIVEDIDGCPKTEEYMYAEYAMMKMQGIDSFRNAHFAKQDLLNEFKLKEKDIDAIEADLYNGQIVRKDYDESYKRGNKAAFVK